MIRDAQGNKMSPRQKAAEVMLERLGPHSNIELSAVGEMTEREVALVNRQVEKFHAKTNKMLTKALGEAEASESEE